jgi:predicted permease
VGWTSRRFDVWTTALHFARTPQPWYLWDNRKFGTIVARAVEGAASGNIASRATIAWRRINDASRDSTRSILLGSIVEGRGPVASRELKITGRIAGVALIVLLVACANIATLSLLRAARRRREIAVRVALGVSRGRLVRQFLTETYLLAAVGGVAAIAFAWWGGTALRGILMPEVSFPGGVLGIRVLVAVVVLAAVAALLAGLAPALQASRPDLTSSLKEGSRTGRLAGARLRTGLLIGQSALSVVLIAGAGLFARSLAKLNEINLGIDPERTILVVLRPAVRSDRELTEVMTEVAGRARQLPGVEHLSLATAGPFVYWNTRDVFLPGSDTSVSLAGEPPGVASVDSAFFDALALRAIEGRTLLASDRRGAPPVMVVSETLARTVWPGKSAVGQCLIPFARTETCFTVVGVVPDVKQWSPMDASRMRYFMSIEQTPEPHPPATNMFVRAELENIDAVASYLRTTVREVMPTARVMWPIVPLARNLEPEYRPWRVGTGLFVALGSLALIVATIGIYSVLAYTMSQRMREMGVRIALGARATDVHRLVLVEGLRVVAIGAAIGVVLALASGNLIASLLYAVSSRDPLTLVVSVGVLLAAGAVAGAIPAWRASRVDPVVALRSE